MDSLKILELAIGGVGGFNLTMPPHLQYFSLYSDIEQIPNYILDSNLKSLKLSSDNLNNIDNIFKMKMLKDIDIVNTPLGQRLRKKDKNALAYVAAIRKQIPKLMLIYFYPDTIL